MSQGRPGVEGDDRERREVHQTEFCGQPSVPAYRGLERPFHEMVGEDRKLQCPPDNEKKTS